MPDAALAGYQGAAEVRDVFARVHAYVLHELQSLPDGDPDQRVADPHPFAKTWRQALIWCAHHEMLHAGQIGLLRRQLGYPPI